MVVEPEVASKRARLGEENRQDAEATETDSDQSEGEIDDENQNKSAYLARFSKRSQASKCIDLIHDTMPCKDVPSLDFYEHSTEVGSAGAGCVDYCDVQQMDQPALSVVC